MRRIDCRPRIKVELGDSHYLYLTGVLTVAQVEAPG